MRQLGTEHVVVMDAGKYVGVLSDADLIQPVPTKPRIEPGRAGQREPI
jgi:hypothetical protein